jgi:hypothetical protein
LNEMRSWLEIEYSSRVVLQGDLQDSE